MGYLALPKASVSPRAALAGGLAAATSKGGERRKAASARKGLVSVASVLEPSAKDGAVASFSPALRTLRPLDRAMRGDSEVPMSRRLAGVFDGAPLARRGGDHDDFFGADVPDPYRWMEDPNSEETRAWTQAHNERTDRFFTGLPEYRAFERRLNELFKRSRFVSMPNRIGGYYYRDRGRLERGKRPNGPFEPVVNPYEHAGEDRVGLNDYSPSPDGRYLAYSLSRNGSDWQEWRVRDLEAKRDLPDVLLWSKWGGASWPSDGAGFYYQRYPRPPPGQEYTAPTRGGKLYFHKLGTPQEEDRLADDREAEPGASIKAFEVNGKFLVVEHALRAPEGGTARGRIWIKSLGGGAEFAGAAARGVFDGDARSTVVGHSGDTLYVLTDFGAPRNRLVAVDARDPSKWKELIPEGPRREVLSSVVYDGERFVATWMLEGIHVPKVHSLSGRVLRRVPVNGRGSVRIGQTINGKLYYTFTSFLHPDTVYRYDLKTGRREVFARGKTPVDLKKFVVKRVFFASKDGTRVPLWIVHKRDLKLDGSNPTYLYGYGGFGISLTPRFSTDRLAWLEQGGVFALASIRGGGEYGREWHDGGRLAKKQNVFDDFIAAAEWLKAAGYARKVGIGGGSNGGLLVAAALTQRPDLFAAAIPVVGVLDMLRYHRFTVGAGWAYDYGLPDTKEGFEALHAYSPVHRVKPGVAYPPTLVVTGDHDDRVVPSHSKKFAAALQWAQAAEAPILLDTKPKTGHAAGDPFIEWAFLAAFLGMIVSPIRGRTRRKS